MHRRNAPAVETGKTRIIYLRRVAYSSEWSWARKRRSSVSLAFYSQESRSPNMTARGQRVAN
jgi:hypothetical protein